MTFTVWPKDWPKDAIETVARLRNELEDLRADAGYERVPVDRLIATLQELYVGPWAPRTLYEAIVHVRTAVEKAERELRAE